MGDEVYASADWCCWQAEIFDLRERIEAIEEGSLTADIHRLEETQQAAQGLMQELRQMMADICDDIEVRVGSSWRRRRVCEWVVLCLYYQTYFQSENMAQSTLSTVKLQYVAKVRCCYMCLSCSAFPFPGMKSLSRSRLFKNCRERWTAWQTRSRHSNVVHQLVK